MVRPYRGNPMKENPIEGLSRIFTKPSNLLVAGQLSSPSPRYYQDPFYPAEIDARRTSADRMLTGPEIQTYVTEVQAMRWDKWRPRAHWPIVVVIANTRAPTYGSGQITVPSRIRELIVLHEIAHHFAGVGATYHDGKFVQAFLDLIEAVRNPAQAEHFREVLTAHGVKW